ncbi:Fungal Zn(2)-Cys(6) binuclear cluster domain [Ceratobasidium sp. AG-Ba]|nr:Fungal Zn(2)-Cys(6) binuclear cluster domain [Ceratobasidium sp. AG-Ba]
MARRREYGLQVDEERLLTSFALPPDHPGAVHPALRNAIYLLSCRSLNSQIPALAQYEPSFVDKIRQGIADALEATHRGDNTHLFTGVILASILLARYLLIMGRTREACHQIASVARFAVSCGLHQLSSLNLGPHSPSSRAPPLLPPPTDYVALGERIHAFWAIFALDRTIVTIADLPSAFGDDGSEYVDSCEKITTQWPRPLQDYRSPDLLAQSGPSGSLADCFSGGSTRGSPNSRSVNHSICTLGMWALEIHHRAHDALRHPGSGTSTRLPLLSRSALRFLHEAPGVETYDDDLGRAGLNPTLVLAYSLIFTAQIKLALAQHGRAAYASTDGAAAFDSAAQLVELLGRVRNVAGLDPMVGLCGMFVFGYLKRIGHGARTHELIDQLEASVAQLRRGHVILGDGHLELRDLP